MVNSGSLSVLLSKNDFHMCCTTVTNKEITEPILGYIVQRANPPCVNAVIFQTQSGLFCINARAPWVRAKIVALDLATILLSLTTSTGSRGHPRTELALRISLFSLFLSPAEMLPPQQTTP
uniref:Chemokine interleukin-8-like domain-containing protein n=1 Tax=Oreochromis aureus TaxID=47969 RepID=A0A668T321_OREAU